MPENIAALREIINENRHVTYLGIEDSLSINLIIIHNIFIQRLESIGAIKLCASKTVHNILIDIESWHKKYLV